MEALFPDELQAAEDLPDREDREKRAGRRQNAADLTDEPVLLPDGGRAGRRSRGHDADAPSAPREEARSALSDIIAPPRRAGRLELPAAVSEHPPRDTRRVVETVTRETTRSSREEFKRDRHDRIDPGRRDADDGLSDLEKVGLIALGAMVVGDMLDHDQDRVVTNSGDRVIILRRDGRHAIFKDDDALLRRPGVTVSTETFSDGSTRTIVERSDGSSIETIRDASGRVLRRVRHDGRGHDIRLFDDIAAEVPVDVRRLPQPRGRTIPLGATMDEVLLRNRMATLDARELGRSFSLRQVREIPELRRQAATINVDSITFETGSAAVRAGEAEELAALGRIMSTLLAEHPGEIFLVEGHTDAVGSAAMNLLLSDRRAESVALALTEFYGIPPENMVVQGYGEAELLIPTDEAEERNRRATVRVVTPLLAHGG
ncbi:OmpA family protein [Cereibacter sphaeroides]|uniref:OmpA family protein n=1 Tax=Cereibacter sphaeroides TaxID=1063 RepID=UPI001F18BA81|nr:OmpA family protein [Cereibacter sphaeroides]